MDEMQYWLAKIAALPEQQRIVALDYAFKTIMRQLDEIDTSEESLLEGFGFNRATVRQWIAEATEQVEAERYN